MNRPEGEHPEPGVAPIKRAGLRINAIGNAAGHLSFFGAIFVLTPIAIRHLGPEGWGIWQLIGATTAYTMLLDLGLTTAIHYQVAVNTASGDYARLAAAFTNVRIYYVVAGVLLIALLLVGGRPLLASLVAAEQLDLAYRALVVTVTVTALTLILRLYPSTLAGLQRLDIVGLFRFGAALTLFGCAYWGFQAGMGLIGFAALMTCGPILFAIPSWVVVRRVLPRAALKFVRIDRGLFVELLSYSLSTMMYTAGSVVLYQTMKFIASWRMGGPEAAGHMGLAVSLAQMFGVVFTPLLTALFARVGHMKGEGRVAEVPELLGRSLVVTGLVLVPGVTFAIVDATAIFDAWVGTSVSAETVTALGQTARLMLLGQCAYIFSLPCYYVLTGIGEHRVFGIGMIAVAFANSLFGWLMAGHDPRIQSLGLVFGILMTALAAFVTMPAAFRRFPVPVARLLGKSLGAPLAAAAPGAVAVLWRPRLGRPIVDLVLDAGLFALLVAPGLEFLRRRLLRADGSPGRDRSDD